ncbi:MAG: signal peptidase I [Clostridia bacterium]|nr:signal peptidase I [Clostridia bacterium]
MDRAKRGAKKLDKKTKIRKHPILVELANLIIKLSLIAVVLVAIFTFIFGLFRVNDNTMLPNVAPGDLVMFYRLDKEYTVSETVVFSYKGQKRTARIVALPGDTVEIDKDGLKVNGNLQYEPMVFKKTLAVKEGIKYPVKLKSDEYFILSDNREKSEDSRLFGPIKKSSISGKVFTLLRRRNI